MGRWPETLDNSAVDGHVLPNKTVSKLSQTLILAWFGIKTILTINSVGIQC